MNRDRSASGRESCIYVGRVWHRRKTPSEHAFAYPLYLAYLDLAELPALFDGMPGWSARRPALSWFRRADYLGDPNVPLDTAVRDEAEARLGFRPEGPVRLLTHLRTFGFLINPITLYYFFDAESRDLVAVLAEVTNTPWGERHCYVVPGSEGDRILHRTPKAFHVSPFMDMRACYRWTITRPRPETGSRLFLGLVSENEDGEDFFEASLSLVREEISARSLAGVLLRFPLMTMRVALGIYWQALRLHLKQVPFVPHPKHLTHTNTQTNSPTTRREVPLHSQSTGDRRHYAEKRP